MRIQPQLILLQKTLLNVEGLGRELYPDLDVFATASPVLREWMHERVSVRRIAGEIRAHLPDLIAMLRTLPPIVQGAVQRAQDGTLRLPVAADGLDELREELRGSQRRRDAMLIAAAALLGGIVWLALERDPAWPGWLLTAAAAVGAFFARRG
jgi:ubiquinone biosynthesis protein